MLETLPYEVSPVSELLGIPLRVSRVKPRSRLLEMVDYDNQGYLHHRLLHYIVRPRQGGPVLENYG